jgi:hypothetical protein
MKKGKNFKTGFLLLAAVVTSAALFSYKEYNRKNESLHKTEADFAVQPEAILSQFANDEKKAHAVYTGKIVFVSGNVKTVDKDNTGFYTIVLGDPASMSSVRCSIDSVDWNKAAAVQKKSTIKLKGICTGYNADEMGLGADVILNRCVIE